MLVSEFPEWVSYFSAGLSIVGVLFCLLLLWKGKKYKRFTYSVYLVLNILSLVAAVFQLGWMSIGAWIILTLGGRFTALILMAVEAGLDH